MTKKFVLAAIVLALAGSLGITVSVNAMGLTGQSIVQEKGSKDGE